MRGGRALVCTDVSAPPTSSMRACATCGVPLDPLRAAVVAILDGRFTYFCSAECKTAAHATSTAAPKRTSLLPSFTRVQNALRAACGSQ